MKKMQTKPTDLFGFVLSIVVFVVFFSPNTLAQAHSPLNHGDSINRGEFHMTMCLFYSDQNQYDSAIFHAESALVIFSDVGDSLGTIDMYHELSLINLDIGIYDEALAYNQLALDLSQLLKDSSRTIHHYRDHALIFHDYKKYDRGIKNGQLGHQLAQKFSKISPAEMADILNSLAVNYQADKEYQQALDYHFMSLKAFGNDASSAIARSYEDSIRLSRVMNSIGNIYLETEGFHRAYPWLVRALRINSLLKDDFELADNLNNLGLAFSSYGDSDSARYYLDQARTHATASGSIEKLMDVFSSYNMYHRFLGNLTEALSYQDRRLSLQDSIAKLKQERTYAALESRYQVIRTQQQIQHQNAQLLEQKNRLQINILISIGLFLTLVILSLIFVFWRYRVKNQQEEALRHQAQKLKEQQTTAVIDSLEKERKRIARDIHDGLGQSISAIGLSLHSLGKSAGNDPSNEANFKNSQALLSTIHDEIRDIAFTLMPNKLIQAGLVEALSELTHRINQSNSLEVRLHAFEVPRQLNETVQLSLFRVTQELLSNIIKYAGAKLVDIQLTGYDNELIILIEDDGIGFDIDHFKNSKGNGWNNISYRLELIQSSIEFDTQPGRKSTTVTIETPYNIEIIPD